MDPGGFIWRSIRYLQEGVCEYCTQQRAGNGSLLQKQKMNMSDRNHSDTADKGSAGHSGFWPMDMGWL